MTRRSVIILLGLLVAMLPAVAADPARPGTKAPIVNFSLPIFTNPEGYRSWLIRGSEAWMTERNIIDVKELSLTLFSGDAANRVDTMMLSPAAHILTDEKIVTGTSTLRVIDLQKEFEATGTGWRFSDKDKTIILNKKVRVVFRAPLTNILK